MHYMEEPWKSEWNWLFLMKWVQWQSQDSVVSKLTGVWTGQSSVWIPVETRDFSLLQNVHIRSGTHSLLFSGSWISLPVVKQLGCDFDHHLHKKKLRSKKWSYNCSTLHAFIMDILASLSEWEPLYLMRSQIKFMKYPVEALDAGQYLV
jgi:hypothetical protein